MKSVSIKALARGAFALAGIAAAVLVFAGASEVSAQSLGSGVLSAKPAHPSIVRKTFGIAGECQPIDFSGVDIKFNRQMGYYQLTVTGIKKFANMEVSLSHQSYSGTPAYWTSMVVGCWKNFIVLPIPTPYYVTMPLNQFVGTRGVEILGATMRVKRNVPRS